MTNLLQFIQTVTDYVDQGYPVHVIFLDFQKAFDRVTHVRLTESQSHGYSKLNGEGITDEDYWPAQAVWKEFNIQSMKDYHNLYNLSDVLLLAVYF